MKRVTANKLVGPTKKAANNSNARKRCMAVDDSTEIFRLLRIQIVWLVLEELSRSAPQVSKT